jgi:4'-phosphopantetheinyl transferase EntD
MSLRPEIAALFPACVSGAEVNAPELAEPLFAEEEASVARAVARRRVEFALGRTAARRALTALGLPKVALPQNPDRSVAWPQAVWGSITHTEGLCAAVAALRRELAGLGIDAERKERVEPRLWHLIATERERAWLSAGPSESERLLRAALLFSAKEAFYKAQFCVSRAWVGFHDAELAFDDRGSFEVRLLVDVGDAFARDTRFEGKYAVLDAHVVTGLVIAPRT